MIATLLLFIRLAITLALYVFLGWALFILWQDFRAQARRVSAFQTPPLVLVYNGSQGEELRQFMHSPVMIGRDPSCDCMLEESTVSTRHAVLSFHHGQWWLEDLGSTNGTLLNGQSVEESVVLTTSDLIRCGKVDLRVLISIGDDAVQPILPKGDFQSE